MAEKITDEVLEYVGILAKLELSGEEAKKAKQEMENMLEYALTLNELDTDGIEPMSHTFNISNVYREDVVNDVDGSLDTLKNAPEQKDNMFKVPKTIG
ncbi:MAG: Asp-tRNA(Asn)/Glu-tRNA(Gln) amidotransferase subunit GatC [Suipraeoptans sp.]